MLGQPSRTAPTSTDSRSVLDELMARHDGLVHAVLRRQWAGSLSYAERLQVGRIGLWHALVGYDPQRGTAFSTYAWPVIQHELWHAVRLRLGQATPSHPRHPLPPRPLALLASADDPAQPDEPLLSAELLEALHALVDRLPPRLRQVVVAYYGLEAGLEDPDSPEGLGDKPPRSLRQLGHELGLSHEAVRLRLWAALVWLRHPAHSLALRQLLGRNTVPDYEHADQQAQRYLRRRGGRQCRP